MPTANGYVTWKWVAIAAAGLLTVALVGGWNAHAWVTEALDKKVDTSAFIDQQGDTKWIKECMIKKCWDNP